MKVTTKSKVKHLIKAGHRVSKFDRGKYEWTGTIEDYVGKEVPDLDGVVAVYAEQRRDSLGLYVALMCVHELEG